MRWGLVKGSSWENAQSSESGAIAAAFRQQKYEFNCATYDLLGFVLNIGPDRGCTVESVYEVNGQPLKLEFIYDTEVGKYTDLVWSDQIPSLIQPYRYWVLEKQCIPGFLAQVLLHLIELHGGPPPSRVKLGPNPHAD